MATKETALTSEPAEKNEREMTLAEVLTNAEKEQKEKKHKDEP